MPRGLVLVVTTLAMIAFAGNSILCRMALTHTAIDPATFTSMRLMSGTLILWLIVRLRGGVHVGSGNWLSGVALFAYAAGFSLAYVSLPAGTGALLLFGAVQATMISYGLWNGERLRRGQTVGFITALGGLTVLFLPGLAVPPLLGSFLMLGAGVAWGVYSLRGKRGGDPTRTTAENFLWAVPLTLALSLAMFPWRAFDNSGMWFALISGALTSGIGYAIWYTALKELSATHAATAQLSVPVIAAVGGVVLLGEHLTVCLLVASVAILGGVALVISGKS